MDHTKIIGRILRTRIGQLVTTLQLAAAIEVWMRTIDQPSDSVRLELTVLGAAWLICGISSWLFDALLSDISSSAESNEELRRGLRYHQRWLLLTGALWLASTAFAVWAHASGWVNIPNPPPG